MSIRAMTWALDARIGDGTAKLVLVALADHVDDETGQCWPSIPYIARRCEMSESTVRRAINRLIGNSFLLREERLGQSSVFTFPIHPCHFDTPVTAMTDTPVTVDRQNPQEPPKGKNTDKAVRGKRGKPRHGQKTKDGKRIWFDKGTTDWQAYAADFSEKHSGIAPPTNWDGAGSWFNYFGE